MSVFTGLQLQAVARWHPGRSELWLPRRQQPCLSRNRLFDRCRRPRLAWTVGQSHASHLCNSARDFSCYWCYVLLVPQELCLLVAFGNVGAEADRPQGLEPCIVVAATQSEEGLWRVRAGISDLQLQCDAAFVSLLMRLQRMIASISSSSSSSSSIATPTLQASRFSAEISCPSLRIRFSTLQTKDHRPLVDQVCLSQTPSNHRVIMFTHNLSQKLACSTY